MTPRPLVSPWRCAPHPCSLTRMWTPPGPPRPLRRCSAMFWLALRFLFLSPRLRFLGPCFRCGSLPARLASRAFRARTRMLLVPIPRLSTSTSRHPLPAPRTPRLCPFPPALLWCWWPAPTSERACRAALWTGLSVLCRAPWLCACWTALLLLLLWRLTRRCLCIRLPGPPRSACLCLSCRRPPCPP